MTRHLAQVVAIEADVRKQTAARLAEAHHPLSAPGMFDGLSAEYRTVIDGGEELTPEGNRVQATVADLLDATRDAWIDLFDVTAARDFTNCQTGTVADVQVGGDVLVRDAPLPWLLWLDRWLDDAENLVKRLPTLPADTVWEPTSRPGVWRSEPRETLRQVNRPEVMVLHEAVGPHAPQTQVINVARTEGVWTRHRFSGALPPGRREEILRKVRLLRTAVHTAREQLKRVEALDPKPGAAVLGFLFD